MQRSTKSGIEVVLPPVRINSQGMLSAQNHRRISSPASDTSKNIPPKSQAVVTAVSKKNIPPILEKPAVRQVPKMKDSVPNFVFQATGKGPAPLISRSGPSNAKYKWTRQSAPANNAQNTKKVIASAAQKRKPPQDQTSRPIKKIANKEKEKEKADISLNSEGFYEVRVDYEHVSKLAEGCGFKNKEVDDVIQADNAHRKAQAHLQATTHAPGTEEEDLSRFELDSGDELSSDEEAC